MKKAYPGEVTMVRTEAARLRFVAFHKEDGGPKWLPCAESRGIPLDILRGSGPVVGGDGSLAGPPHAGGGDLMEAN